MKHNALLEDEVVDQFEELLHRVETLEFQLQQVFERNQRVESNKRWEVSGFRNCIVAIMTYVATASVFFLIGVEDFLLNAWIPAIAYLLSTLSLQAVRSRVERSHKLHVLEPNKE